MVLARAANDLRRPRDLANPGHERDRKQKAYDANPGHERDRKQKARAANPGHERDLRRVGYWGIVEMHQKLFTLGRCLGALGC